MQNVIPFAPGGRSYFLTGEDRHHHGVDIAAALQGGLLSTADCERLLAACVACRQAPERAGRAVAPGAAPDWCANRPVLEALRGLV